jgi:hypothetical protein
MDRHDPAGKTHLIGDKIMFIDFVSRVRNLTQRKMVIAGAALILLGALAYATIPDTNGIIHGCYKKSGGTLRVIDDTVSQCDSRAEIPIQWSQTGPQGPAGPAGYSLATSATSEGVHLPPGQFTQILSKDLPAGNWVISASAIVDYDGATANPNLFLTSCQLRSGGTAIGIASDWGSESATELVSRTLPLNGIATLSEPGTVSVWCYASLGEGISFNGRGTSEMTIIQVSNIF